MYYFTSDAHFDDKKTLEYEFRPFRNPRQFDRYVIKTWNKQAKKGDIIFVVGDFVDCDGLGFDSWRKSLGYVKKIKADVVLIMGNNEDRVVKFYFDNDFNKFRDYCLERYGNFFRRYRFFPHTSADKFQKRRFQSLWAHSSCRWAI